MFFTTGAAAACSNVPSMKIEDACKACPGKSAYAACKETLQSAPDPAEVTTYVLMVARKAHLKYNSTMNAINLELGAGKDRRQEEAMVYCRDMYEKAYDLMASGAAHLSGCDFGLAEGKFSWALSTTGACLNIVRETAFPSSWMANRVKPGFDLTVVVETLAYLLIHAS
jgi:pectinesterase inhibitor-like protein